MTGEEKELFECMFNKLLEDGLWENKTGCNAYKTH